MKAGVDPLVLKAGLKEMQQELAEYRKQLGFAEEWLRAYAEHERQARNLVGIAHNVSQPPDSMTLLERKEIFDMFNIRVTPGTLENTAKPGVKCEIGRWHHETATLVPPDPMDEEWEAVLAVLRKAVSGKSKNHFTSKYDIRAQFSGMLHRLRQGLSWVDMPLTWGPINPMRERQLFWWKRGVWPEFMTVLGADRRGVEAYRRPTLPQVTVTGRFRAGRPVEVRSEAPKDKGTP